MEKQVIRDGDLVKAVMPKRPLSRSADGESSGLCRTERDERLKDDVV